MVVVPLGLGTSLRRFPWVTVAMASFWLVFMLFDRSTDLISDRMIQASAKHNIRDASRDLFKQYCAQRRGSPKECARYARLVWTGYPSLKDLKKPTRRKTGAVSRPAGETELERDMRLASKAMKRLKNCSGSKKCFAYKDIVWQFLDGEQNAPQRFANLRAFPTYAQAMGGFHGELKRLCKQWNCLTKANVSMQSLTLAQLRHGSLSHLFGNMMVFIIFGIYVEQRSRRTLYALTIALGGTLGLALHTHFFGALDSMVLGASANVSAVLGMFYVFFFDRKMRLQVWLPRKLYLGTPYFAEVKYCFPLIFLLSDVIGSIDRGFVDLSAPKVAHSAHLIGFGIGVLMAWIIKTVWPIPEGLIYESEAGDVRQLLGISDVEAVLRNSKKMLQINPDNTYAMEIGCSTFVQWATTSEAKLKISLYERGRFFLAEHLQSYCAIQVKAGKPDKAYRLLRMVPNFLPFEGCLGHLGQVNALILGDYALAQGDALLALRIFDFYLGRYSLATRARSVEDTALNIIGSLMVTDENVKELSRFLAHHKRSILAPRIAAWLSNVSQAGA